MRVLRRLFFCRTPARQQRERAANAVSAQAGQEGPDAAPHVGGRPPPFEPRFSENRPGVTAAAAGRDPGFEGHEDVGRRVFLWWELDLDTVPAPIGKAARWIDLPFNGRGPA